MVEIINGVNVVTFDDYLKRVHGIDPGQAEIALAVSPFIEESIKPILWVSLARSQVTPSYRYGVNHMLFSVTNPSYLLIPNDGRERPDLMQRLMMHVVPDRVLFDVGLRLGGLLVPRSIAGAVGAGRFVIEPDKVAIMTSLIR